jgi:hypothetical protein
MKRFAEDVDRAFENFVPKEEVKVEVMGESLVIEGEGGILQTCAFFFGMDLGMRGIN